LPGTSLYLWLRPSTQLSSPSLYCRGPPRGMHRTCGEACAAEAQAAAALT
jgi:hypothetical protein